MLLVASPPSIIKVFWSARAPATVPPFVLVSPVCPGPLKPEIAMGWSISNAVASRLRVGMLERRFESNTLPILASRVWSSTAPAWTSTTCVIWPNSKVTLTRADFPTATFRLLTTACRKFEAVTVSL